ncbi:cytochrome P450 [Aspergillus pseudonomiae]|nr:cytochrome P450 [Aspergillus pseudonomiae]
MEGSTPIPEPQGLPLLGNIKDVNPEFPLGSMVGLADELGEIYRLRFPGRTTVFISTYDLVNEVCDEKRFKKSVNSALSEVRNGVHDGLFTAREGEVNWGIAHRVLMPAFGPLSIQSMFDEMHDIATQLALKWARYGPETPIMVTDDFTRLTLDTLALCSMGFRFNSYYSPELHPFIEAMGDFLTMSGERPRRLPLPSIFYKGQDEKYEADIQILRKTAEGVLKSRKAHKSERRDLLTAMLEGVDSKTGQSMTDESIMDNLITFLIAGHETTSGLLSFAFYQLLKYPEIYRKARQEVDDVVGEGTIKVEHMSKLPYIAAILRETLRINATIPLFTVEAYEDTLIGGKYAVKKGETIVSLLAKSHLDPAVYGEDANEFKPERMLDDNFNRLTREFPNCWKPFGNGMRACIGRPFAWQEALLVMAMLLQNFDFEHVDPDYKLGIKQTLTIKPKDFFMTAKLRGSMSPTQLERRLAGIEAPIGGKQLSASNGDAGAGTGLPLTILYGSNTGTCEALAQRLAADAASHGFHASTVDSMDSGFEALPTDRPIVIITASYEGQPPDNAARFVSWMDGLNEEQSPLKDLTYAVFGCGNHEWAQTFHRIPKLVDTTFERAGASRVAEIGLADAANGDIFTSFETWEDEILWPALAERYSVAADSMGKAAPVDATVSTPRLLTLRQDLQEAIVVDAWDLSTGEESVKRHIEIRLPEGMSYQPGDYLAVLPVNPKENVHRAMRRFGLSRDAYITITTKGQTSLPSNESVSAYDILSSYIELAQPATKRNIHSLAEAAQDERTKAELSHLATEVYTEEISAKTVSVLDLLERYPSVTLSLGSFLSMMPPMRVRQYSISSSPLSNPNHATLTFTILDKPALSGQGRHIGVASSYLASLMKSDVLSVSIRHPQAPFRLPENPSQTPIICIAAGTGIAPFRGFIQERALLLAQGQTLAPAALFFGTRSPEQDDLYAVELTEWEQAGAVEVYRTFSRCSEASEQCRYVQDRVWRERERFMELWEMGAKVFVCGSRSVGDGVREAIIRILVEAEGKDKDGVTARFEAVRNVRYVTDVFD